MQSRDRGREIENNEVSHSTTNPYAAPHCSLQTAPLTKSCQIFPREIKRSDSHWVGVCANTVKP